jgi:hypothetical protein
MTNIMHFMPEAETTAQANLEAFIKLCRPLLNSYPAIKSWEETPWDLAGVVEQTGRGTARIASAFTSYEASQVRGAQEMAEPFLSFAKAYFLYQQAFRPTTAFSRRLAALRALEKALVDVHGASDPWRTTAAICNQATTLIKKRFSENIGYSIGRELTVIAGFLSEKRLAPPFQWQCHLRCQKYGNRVGQQGDEARAKKLPSQAALDALPQCFIMATEPRDVLVTSVAALLCAAPDRIGELFGLPADCEVDGVHKGKSVYGLRWWPEKGAKPMTKWIAPTMVDVAKTAIRRLRDLTQPAREISAWYEQNPGRLFLPSGTEHFRNREFLLHKEVACILGLERRTSASNWLRLYGVPQYDIPTNARIKRVRFDEFEQAVLAQLPAKFPIIDSRTRLKYSEALLVVRANELHSRRSTFHCLVEPVNFSQINNGLGNEEDKGAPSIFSRFGFREPDGQYIRLTSHKLRHWLNTLAQRGGMSQLDIAKWSGRRDVRQNEVYDHMTSDELIQMTRELTEGDARLFGPLAELIANAPVSCDEFLALEFPTAHITEIGFCVHDYTMLPCQKHRDCINCNEHVCVKGDRNKTHRIKVQLELAEGQLKNAEGALEEGCFGADRWCEHHVATVARLRNLVDILEDPAVPQGSLIRLTKSNEFSPIRLAMRDRRIAGPLASNPFDDLQSLLGGS